MMIDKKGNRRLGNLKPKSLSPLEIFALAGVVVFVVSAILSGYLILVGIRARDLDEQMPSQIEGPCLHPLASVESDRRVITEKESLDIAVHLSNGEEIECEAGVRIDAPNFEISPNQETQTTILPPGETATVIWVVTPREIGTFQIGISSELDSQSIGISVRNVIGLTARQVELLGYVGNFFGPALTLPWIYTTWNERRKEKEEKEKREAEIDSLKKQIEEIKAQGENRR
jgi:hypothetical protein